MYILTFSDDISKWSQRIVDQTVDAEVKNKHFAAGGVSEMPPDLLWNWLSLQPSLLGPKVTVKSEPAKPILTSSGSRDASTKDSTSSFSAASDTYIYTSTRFLKTLFSTSTSNNVLFKTKNPPKSAPKKLVSTSTVTPGQEVGNSLTSHGVGSSAHASLLTVTLGQPNRINSSSSVPKSADTFTSSLTRDYVPIQANSTLATPSPKGAMKINTTKAFVFVGIVLGLVAMAITVAIVIKKNIGQWTCLR